MANTDAPQGLVAARRIDGLPLAGAQVCHVPATDSTVLGRGDAVKLTGTAKAGGTAPVVTRAAAGDAIYGVVEAVVPTKYDDTNYRVASTATDVLVRLADHQTVYHVQVDGAFAITDVGNTADLTVANADTNTGLSQMELDSTDIGTGAGCKIIGLADIPGNEVGTNAVVEVLLNEIYAGSDAAGV